MPSFPDNDFSVFNATDQSKSAYFDLSALTTGTVRRVALQDDGGTVPYLEFHNTWLSDQEYGIYFITFTNGSNLTSVDNTGIAVSVSGDQKIALGSGQLSLQDLGGGLPLIQWENSSGNSFLVSPAFATPRTWTLPDASGTLAISGGALTYTALQTFPDNCFKVVGSTTASKTFVIECDGASANADCVLAWVGTADRTITLPDATTTLAGLAVDQVFTGVNTFTSVPTVSQASAASSTDFILLYSVADAATLGIAVDGTAFTGAQIILPGAGGTLLTTAGIGTTSFRLTSSTASTGASFMDTSTNTKRLRMILSGAVGNNSFTFTNTAARNYGFGNLSGNVVIVGDDPPSVASGALGKVDLTAQTADITTTNLSNTPPAGLYEVEVYLATTTGAGAGGTLAVVIGWTDVVGATTETVIAAHSLVATGRTKGRATVQVASGNIDYAVTVTGIYSTAAYAVYVRVKQLG